MSRKNFRRDRKAERILSRDPAHCRVCALLWVCLSSQVSFFGWRPRPSSAEAGQAKLVVECQPWFYRRLVAYRYFWLSEAAYRVMGDSVPKHAGPISLTDTHLEPSVSRTRPTTTRENHRRWKGLLPETLKRLADAIVWRRNLLLSSKWLA